MAELCALNDRISIILHTLAKSAAREIGYLVQDSYASLCMDVSQSKSEILRLKRRLEVAEGRTVSTHGSEEEDQSLENYAEVKSMVDNQEGLYTAGASPSTSMKVLIPVVSDIIKDKKIAPSSPALKTSVMQSYEKHVTCVGLDDALKVERCTSCCSLYHCPFCQPSLYKPSEYHMIITHLQSHFNSAVKTKDYMIYMCSLTCRSRSHFHCCYCNEIRINRLSLFRHLRACHKLSLTTNHSKLKSCKATPLPFTLSGGPPRPAAPQLLFALQPLPAATPQLFALRPLPAPSSPAAPIRPPNQHGHFQTSHTDLPLRPIHPLSQQGDSQTHNSNPAPSLFYPEAPPNIDVGRHVTCLRLGESPKVERCTSCCSLYHCPFCEPSVYKPSEYHMIVTHMQSHLRTTIKTKEFIIYNCNLKCRTRSHRHCCYCRNSLMTRENFLKHIKACRQSRSKWLASLQGLPLPSTSHSFQALLPPSSSVPPSQVLPPPPSSITPSQALPPPASPPSMTLPPPPSIPSFQALPPPSSIPPSQAFPPPSSIPPSQALPLPPASSPPMTLPPPPPSIPPSQALSPPPSSSPPSLALPPPSTSTPSPAPLSPPSSSFSPAGVSPHAASASISPNHPNPKLNSPTFPSVSTPNINFLASSCLDHILSVESELQETELKSPTPEPFSRPPTPNMERCPVQPVFETLLPASDIKETEVAPLLEPWQTTSTTLTERPENKPYLVAGKHCEGRVPIFVTKMMCDQCGILLNKKNFRVHLQRRHKEEFKAFKREEARLRELVKKSSKKKRLKSCIWHKGHKHNVVRCKNCHIVMHCKNFRDHMRMVHHEDLEVFSHQDVLNRFLELIAEENCLSTSEATGCVTVTDKEAEQKADGRETEEQCANNLDIEMRGTE